MWNARLDEASWVVQVSHRHRYLGVAFETVKEDHLGNISQEENKSLGGMQMLSWE